MNSAQAPSVAGSASSTSSARSAISARLVAARGRAGTRNGDLVAEQVARSVSAARASTPVDEATASPATQLRNLTHLTARGADDSVVMHDDASMLNGPELTPADATPAESAM
eukprot:SAG31_NODE_16750_length_697_cov_1.543478_2_plen_111_part_01